MLVGRGEVLWTLSSIVLSLFRPSESAPVEATPSDWKELRESEKFEYLHRNYGVALTGGSLGSEAAYARTPAELWTLMPPLRVTSTSRDGESLKRASEETPALWKELSEAEKYEYLGRNYGVKPLKYAW